MEGDWSVWLPPDPENGQKPKDLLNFEEKNMQLLEASTPQDRKTCILFYSLAFCPSPSWYSWSLKWPCVADILIWSGWLSDDRRWERLVNHDVATLQSIFCFIVYFTLKGHMIYKMNIILYWRRLETSDFRPWPHWEKVYRVNGSSKKQGHFLISLHKLDLFLQPVDLTRLV